MFAIAEKAPRGSLDELSFHFAPQVVLFTAARLGIFAALAGGPRSAASIAATTDCSTRGVRMLLNALAAMGLMEKRDEVYDLNRGARKYCLSASEDDLTSLFLSFEDLFQLWLTLPAAVRTGRPVPMLRCERKRQQINLHTAESLFHAHRIPALRLVETFCREEPGWREDRADLHILDVAAGSAVWSIPWALRWRNAEVAAMDFSPVLKIARRYAQRFGVKQRYRFVGANIRDIEFGNQEYDLTLLGHICHSEGACWSQKLIEKCFRALKQDGRLFIMDYVVDDERKSELLPLLLALNSLLGTKNGDTFAFSEYRGWMTGIGFKNVRMVGINGHSPVIVGTKE